MNKMDVFERLRSGEVLYGWASDCPEALEALTVCADKCYAINSLPPSHRAEREAILRELLGSAGHGLIVNPPFRCDFGFNIHIGSNFIGNFNLTILDEAEVRIGNNVLIGPNCTLVTINHDLDACERAKGLMQARPIVLEDDVWLAANVTVLPGVRIGRGSVVGAGSVVTKSIPAGVVAAGVPARVIRNIKGDVTSIKNPTSGHLP